VSDEHYISIIGLGRVGLPLALSFADRGIRVLGVDNDPVVLDSIRGGQMPFNEAGTQELLDRVMATGRLQLSDRAADAARAQDIVLTQGTPSFSHIESDLRQVRAAVDDLLPLLRPGHALLIGADLVKPERDLLLAYDDPLGVTAAFNLNVLRNLNRLLGADFDVLDWRRQVAALALRARSAPRRRYRSTRSRSS